MIQSIMPSEKACELSVVLSSREVLVSLKTWYPLDASGFPSEDGHPFPQERPSVLRSEHDTELPLEHELQKSPPDADRTL